MADPDRPTRPHDHADAPSAARPAPPPPRRRWLWFAALYGASILVVGAVAYILRTVIVG